MKRMIIIFLESVYGPLFMLLLFVIFITYAFLQEKNTKELCEKRGGVSVTKEICAKKDAIIELKED